MIRVCSSTLVADDTTYDIKQLGFVALPDLFHLTTLGFHEAHPKSSEKAMVCFAVDFAVSSRHRP